MSQQGPEQPEYLAPETSPRPSGHRRTALVAAASVAVVAAVGAGTFGVVQFFASGGSAATAVPGSAVGYVSLDLDPSAAQKIEAIKILRKFPAIRKEIKIGSRDDVRRRVFDAVVKESGCRSLDYDDDVKPWIGNRVALAAVPGTGRKVLPLVALQVSDEDRARAGVKTLQKCGSNSRTTGVSFVGDYMLLTDKQADATRLAKAAKASPLSDDADFKTWMGRVGDPGIVTMYASKDAPRALVQAEGGAGITGDSKKQLDAVLKDFDGAAGVLRFQDGAVETEILSKGAGGVVGGASKSAGHTDAGSLPATTGAVLAVAFPKGWLKDALDSLRGSLGDDEVDKVLKQAEQATGLDLPDDAETLFGDGLTVSVDSSIDPSAVSSSPDLAHVPAGIRIRGDRDKILAIVAKLKAAVGSQADVVTARGNGDFVALGTDRGYVDDLLKKGDLGGTPSFKDVVPEADKAQAVLFVSFDAGNGWADRLADRSGDREIKANLAPLKAFGASSWTDDDDIQHIDLRLSTD